MDNKAHVVPLPAPIKDPLTVLRSVFKIENFRPAQKKAVETVLSGKDCLVLLPTGGGKSLCYQVPAMCREGVALVISPLLALIQDQVASLKAKGIKSAALSSAVDAAERSMIISDLRSLKPQIKILYVTPEQIATSFFRELITPLGNWGLVSLVAVDEAHCISEWGFDFRKPYRRIGELRYFVGSAPFIALTATATREVKRDIIEKLGMGSAEIIQASFDRPNIEYHFRSEEYMTAIGSSKVGTLESLLLSMKQQCGIIYCGMRQTVDDLTAYLNKRGIKCAGYHAGQDQMDRTIALKNWLSGEYPVIIATIAFGMGIDNASVRFVIHFDPPKSIEAFYQESGRAGRDGLPAKSIVFYSLDQLRRMAAQANSGPQNLRPGTLGVSSSGGTERITSLVELLIEPECRRKKLLMYFGERLQSRPKRCCDFCLAPQLAEVTYRLLTTGSMDENVSDEYAEQSMLTSRRPQIKTFKPASNKEIRNMSESLILGEKNDDNNDECCQNNNNNNNNNFQNFTSTTVNYPVKPIIPIISSNTKKTINKYEDVEDASETVHKENNTENMNFSHNVYNNEKQDINNNNNNNNFITVKSLVKPVIKSNNRLKPLQMSSTVKNQDDPDLEKNTFVKRDISKYEEGYDIKMQREQKKLLQQQKKEQRQKQHMQNESVNIYPYINKKIKPENEEMQRSKNTGNNEKKVSKDKQNYSYEDYLKTEDISRYVEEMSNALYNTKGMEIYKNNLDDFRERCNKLALKIIRIVAITVSYDNKRGKPSDFNLTVSSLIKYFKTNEGKLDFRKCFTTKQVDFMK